MNIVIFSRVSTNSQDNHRQVQELTEFAIQQGWKLQRVFEEKAVSGAKKNIDRPILQEMLTYIREEQVQKVLCWEISRIGRNSFEVLQTISLLNTVGVSLFIKNWNIETLDNKGAVNPLSQFMVQILTSVAQMERTTIQQRMNSGYKVYRDKGGQVGRKVGWRKSQDSFLKENQQATKLLKQEYPLRAVAQRTGRSVNTILKLKKLMNAA